jgi:hypothetical protein
MLNYAGNLASNVWDAGSSAVSAVGDAAGSAVDWAGDAAAGGVNYLKETLGDAYGSIIGSDSGGGSAIDPVSNKAVSEVAANKALGQGELDENGNPVNLLDAAAKNGEINVHEGSGAIKGHSAYRPAPISISNDVRGDTMTGGSYHGGLTPKKFNQVKHELPPDWEQDPKYSAIKHSRREEEDWYSEMEADEAKQHKGDLRKTYGTTNLDKVKGIQQEAYNKFGQGGPEGTIADWKADKKKQVGNFLQEFAKQATENSGKVDPYMYKYFGDAE